MVANMATGFYSTQNNAANCDYSSAWPPLPLHLCLFLLSLPAFICFSWYISYESALESMLDQLKLLLMASPLVLLLLVHWCSNSRNRTVLLDIPLPERDSFHRVGGSPWGVALVLLLLVFMISYQSNFRDRWFPLLNK